MAAVIVVILAGLVPVALQAEPVSLAVVQTEIDQEDFASLRTFTGMITRHVEEAVAMGADLVVFPEYLNVFLATVPYHQLIADATSLAEGLHIIFSDPARPQSARELFVQQAPAVRRTMDRIYGRLADTHNIYILAGTYFAVDAGPAGNLAELNRAESDDSQLRLTNRSVLYGPHGNAVHEQDKVFLTPIEEDLLELDAGRIADVHGIEVYGMDVGITICRDTFFPIWDEVHAERDLWIDLRAEGTAWEPGREDFTELMPERLRESGSSYGATAALTGEFLDLFWEGKSSVTAVQGSRPKIVAMTESHRGDEILVFELTAN
ncbi:putative amidohydrolase [Spirochaeta africana DSM 8902]|uniref:Putative amidohydrolase n=2 Tax=Spirochaeta TaxID=146 RepID=H9UL28_SPIAZ|nr:putative amidohydrolase [Spirochaeta africana DSM 8902]